jgi:hypothetical protein
MKAVIDMKNDLVPIGTLLGDQVTVQNVSMKWNGRIGTVLRWVSDGWYIVLVDGTELVLDADRGEMMLISE